MPVKLCYLGNTYVNYTDYKGRLKETTQCGAELIGDATISAGAEILAMTVESLKAAGLHDFQISVGHAQFFLGLLHAAMMNEEEEAQLRELLHNKNFFGVEEFADNLHLSEDLRVLFGLLASFDSSDEALFEAREKANNYPEISDAIEQLIELRNYLKIYGIEKYISYELGIISDHQYYTGIIFSGYTFGTGEAIVKGGRYDKLLGYFGKNAPAIGFGIIVDQLLLALSRQKIEIDLPNNFALLVFEKEHAAEAIRKAQILRAQGTMVQTVLFDDTKTKEDYFNYAAKNHISRVEFL